MLAIMAGAGGYLALLGNAITVAELAAFIGRPLSEVEPAYSELIMYKVFSLDRKGTPYNRRMVRSDIKASASRHNGTLGGRPRKITGEECVSEVGKQGGNLGYDKPQTRVSGKSLKINGYLDSETQTITQSKPNPKPKTPPTRAPLSNLSQDSQKKDSSQIQTEALSYAPRDICPIAEFSLEPQTSLPVAIPIEVEFAEWYSAYPLKVKPRLAEAAYARARRKASPAELLDGIERYRNNKPAYADWAHPTSWLNAERWRDQAPDMPSNTAIDAEERVMETIRAAATEADRRNAESQSQTLKLINGGNHG